jgi:hypothetical protein
MTRQDRNQSYDQKKGSADLRTQGQRVGMPGRHIAEGELGEPAESPDLRDVVDKVEGREPARRTSRTIPEQEGCGPDVTDYPGLGAPTGTDAQSTGSDT